MSPAELAAFRGADIAKGLEDGTIGAVAGSRHRCARCLVVTTSYVESGVRYWPAMCPRCAIRDAEDRAHIARNNAAAATHAKNGKSKGAKR